jgi:hypothetical protein
MSKFVGGVKTAGIAQGIVEIGSLRAIPRAYLILRAFMFKGQIEEISRPLGATRTRQWQILIYESAD